MSAAAWRVLARAWAVRDLLSGERERSELLVGNEMKLARREGFELQRGELVRGCSGIRVGQEGGRQFRTSEDRCYTNDEAVSEP